MRKIVAIVIMVIVAGGYVWSIRNQDDPVQNKETMIQGLEGVEHILAKGYPSTPEKVIETYNQIMLYQYGEGAVQEELSKSVSIARKLYHEEMLQLNTEEAQVEALQAEVEKNKAAEQFLLSSVVQHTTMLDEETAEVQVEHIMTTGYLQRTYFLVKQEGAWKVHSWSEGWN